jgi:lipopolysaccharide transport system permease protein
MLTSLRELYESRELLFTWTRRDFRVRYSQSMLGAAWAVMQPLSLMVIFSIVFAYFLEVPTGGVPYPVFSYAALLPWTFFSNALGFAIPSLVSNMNLVSKIYFPREILPLSAILVGLVDFVIASLLFVPMMIYYRIAVGPALLLLPVLLLIQIVFMFAVSLLASAANVYFRDVRFLIPLTLQVWLYITPVIYSAEQIPGWLKPFYFLNPMAALIDGYRRVTLFNQMPDWPYVGLAALVSLLLFIVAYRVFKRAERQFADLI